MSDQPNHPFPGRSDSDAGQRQVRLQMDEREMSTSYANAFRTNATTDEVFIDFGVNLIVPSPTAEQGKEQANQPVGQLTLKFNDRVILNYRTAKRLAIMLGQVIRHHEERFGEIKLEQPNDQQASH